MASGHKAVAGDPKRRIIKRMVIDDRHELPESLLAKAQACGVDSTVKSVTSIRGDFLITARVLAKLGRLDPSWQVKLPPGKPSTLDELNEIVFHERDITNEELLSRLAPYASTVSRGTIIGSRTASLQSIDLMEEAGVVTDAGGGLGAALKAEERDNVAAGIEKKTNTQPNPSIAIYRRQTTAVDTSNVREMGEGQQNVYVYGFDFAPDRLKVGKAEGDVVRRIVGQINTGTPGKPILYLIFRTDDCHNLEKALHRVLCFRGRKVPGGGSEWFHTNCDELIEIYKLCVGSAPA
jgi:hypothetical protein